MKKVSIVIPIFNHLKMTIECLNDVIRTYGVETEIIAVDDGSTEPVSKAIAKMFPQVKVLRNEKNLGFARTVNKGIEAASHDLICLLNNDIKLPNPSWLKLMVNSIEENNFDMTAPAFGRLDKKWNYIPGEIKRQKDLSNREFQYPVGWCLLIKKKVFDKIGLIPIEFGVGFWEDVLFNYKAKEAKFKMGITENTGVEHLYHTTFKSSGIDITKQYENNRRIFLRLIRK